MPSIYIRTLAKLYEIQTGRVVADRISKPFEIQRGTKQGDPLSPKLFNAVLEKCMKRLQSSWRRKGYGISFGGRSEDQLCNLRFADDLLVFAASRSQLGKMITDLSSAVGAIGLELHMGKTKVLTKTDTA